jgi:hypothetical protein
MLILALPVLPLKWQRSSACMKHLGTCDKRAKSTFSFDNPDPPTRFQAILRVLYLFKCTIWSVLLKAHASNNLLTILVLQSANHALQKKPYYLFVGFGGLSCSYQIKKICNISNLLSREVKSHLLGTLFTIFYFAKA